MGKASMLLLLAVLATLDATTAMNNGLARKPPMGWSSWNAFGGHQSQKMMLSTAQAIIHTGLRDLGYTFLSVDGGWDRFDRGGLNASGYPEQPGGWDFRNLTDYYHSVGLELGMYVTGGYERVYSHEAAWTQVMFNE